jgi:glycogen(starch) synthase
MASQARRMVQTRYGWSAIARKTAASYRAAVTGAPEAQAQARAKLLAARPTIVVPEGNLLAL